MLSNNATRKDFYSLIAARNLKPLWEVLRGQLTAEPNPPEVPVLWRYEDLRPFLLEAVGLISVEEADRRVLVLENPALPDRTRGYPIAIRRFANNHAAGGRAMSSPHAGCPAVDG